MPRLRGHHLICLHFFDGEGYSEDFVENLRAVLNAAEDNDVEVITGADDVCGKCPHFRNQRCQFNETADEEVREMDAVALSLLKLAPGTKSEWKEIREILPVLFSQWYNSYCAGCDWKRACERSEFFKRLR